MSSWILPLVILLCIDAAFFLALALLVKLFSRGQSAGIAVLKRNFAGYFSNPTGYLFILLFVSLCSFGAFYPDDFFNDNLATLHQLNIRFPWIMLVYIPTITMGIWSEERRQGTDELLLTVPATDWDIVFGKFLAATAIYSVSLVFAQAADFMVLSILSRGEVDLGLFATTYLGYWLIGVAMIALGMVGSFLTRNVTIGFILGVLLNLPLVLAVLATSAISGGIAQTLAGFSFAEQLADIGRGVISVRSLVFFLSVIAIGLYLSLVLVGRRHWSGGRDGTSLAGHFLLRVVSLILVALGLSSIFLHHDLWHIDGTSNQVNRLSAGTRHQIKQVTERLKETDRTVLVEAFISQPIPEDYAKTKVDLLSKLREFDSLGGNQIEVRVFDNLERFSDAAVNADEKYAIRPTPVVSRDRGKFKDDQSIIMGAAFTCGLEKVVVPFFDQGIPVEYELLRSISTVVDQKRKRLGILNTDVQLFGGFDMQRMQSLPKQLIVEELQKQYEIVQLDPNSPIEQALDVLLVVQPSSLTQPQMDNLVAAVKKGIPTALFEDPMPVMMQAPGTSQPKMPRGGGMMGMGQPPEPKGDISELWNALGIRMSGQSSPAGMGALGGGASDFSADVVWQNYNPYQKVSNVLDITAEWVFASPSAPGGERSLNPNEPAVSGLQQILFLYPGAIENRDQPGLQFTPLITTGDYAGTVPYQDIMSGVDARGLAMKRVRSGKPLVLAARIRSAESAEATKTSGLTPADNPFATRFVADELPRATGAATPPAANAASPTPGAAPTPPTKIDVVYVGDIDLMHSQFLKVRAQPNMSDVHWKFDNVTFVLNVVDELAKDVRFIDVRKKEPRHSTLKLVEDVSAKAKLAADTEIKKFNDQFAEEEAKAKESQKKAVDELQKQIDDLTKKAQESGTQASGREIQRALQAALQQMMLKEQVEQRRVDTKLQQLARDRDRSLQRIELDLDKKVQTMQNYYKWMALLIPLLPPILIGIGVFIRRRAMESEGMSPQRRR